MSIFGKIMGAIFGSHASATPAGGATAGGSAPASGQRRPAPARRQRHGCSGAKR